MKRSVIIKKCVVFLLIFIMIFLVLQRTLRYKWEKDENISIRMEQYENEKFIDVVYFGSSPIYASMYPMVMWGEYGIPSYNLGISMQNAMLTYYQVEYALKYQKPKVIVIDLCALTSSRSADEEKWEPTYRKVIETMEDTEIKSYAIKDIVENNANQDYLSYYFPLVRYHSRWNELTQIDFDSKLWDKWYDIYKKGALMSKDIEPISTNMIITNEKNVEIDLINKNYYDKILELCLENGIEVVVVTLPRYDGTWGGSMQQATYQYCVDNDIQYIDYSSKEKIDEIGLDLQTDFYNTGHLNYNGGKKVTTNLGYYLQQWYGLENHKDDSDYEEWNELYKEYEVAYEAS